MTAHTGVWTAPAARSLRPVLQSWTKLILAYSAKQADDLAYWYNERATLSVLAAAAWMSRGIALEEYSSRKHAADKGEFAAGRADLWIRHDRLEMAVEAKQTWPTMTGIERGQDVREAIASACEDARKLLNTAAPHRAGAVFVVPDVAPRYHKSFDSVSTVASIRSVEHDFAAWAFLPPPWPKSPITANRFPGVVLLGRLVSRANARAA